MGKHSQIMGDMMTFGCLPVMEDPTTGSCISQTTAIMRYCAKMGSKYTFTLFYYV